MKDNVSTTTLNGFLLAGTGTALFSIKGILIKYCYMFGADVYAVIALRMFFSAPFYLIALLVVYRPKVLPAYNSMLGIAVLGIVGYYLASLLNLCGLELIDASLERIILYAYPTVVVFLSAMVNRVPVHPSVLISVLVVYTGLVLVFSGINNGEGYVFGEPVFVGMLYVAASAITFAIYIVGSEFMLRRFCSGMYTSIAMLSASVVIAIHVLVEHPLEYYFLQNSEVYVLAFAIAIICTVLPSFLVSAGIQRIGAAKAGAVGSIGPLVTLVLSVILLGEVLSLVQLIGFCVVVAGVYYLSRLKS